MVKQMAAFKFSEAMKTALDELVHPDRLMRLANSRTGWLEVCLAWYLKEKLLKGQISQRQLDTCITPDDNFRLFVIFSRAKRGEAGYKLIEGKTGSHHEKDKEQQMQEFRDKPLEVWAMKVPDKATGP